MAKGPVAFPLAPEKIGEDAQQAAATEGLVMDKDARTARLDAAWRTHENRIRRTLVWALQLPISERRLSRRIAANEARLHAHVIEIETHDPKIVALLAKMGFEPDE